MKLLTLGLAIILSLVLLNLAGPAQANDNSSDNSTVDLTVVVPPPAPPPPAGGGGAPSTPDIVANLFGTAGSFKINSEGIIQETVTATSADSKLTITIPKDTKALDKDGKPLSSLTAVVNASPPPPPAGANVIGLAYNFGPNGATFNPPLTLTWSYDPNTLPTGVAEEDLVIAYYDEVAGKWVELQCVVDAVNNKITASVSHFTTFTIIGTVTPPEEEKVVPPEKKEEVPPEKKEEVPLAPAAFSVSNLTVQPAEVKPKEAVVITVSVANTGGTQGSYSVVLKINGVKEAEKSATVAPGGIETVAFSVTREEPGSYTVAVDGLSGSFTVVAVAPPPRVNWPLIGTVIAVVIAVATLLVFFLVIRRKKRESE